MFGNLECWQWIQPTTLAWVMCVNCNEAPYTVKAADHTGFVSQPQASSPLLWYMIMTDHQNYEKKGSLIIYI